MSKRIKGGCSERTIVQDTLLASQFGPEICRLSTSHPAALAVSFTDRIEVGKEEPGA